MKKHERMEEIYESGSIPWDHQDPPPEVVEIVSILPVGRALDLGCGLGRASIYLAQHGWQVDGVDFISQAIKQARQRAAQANVTERVNFHLSPVTDLSFLKGPYDFALDVGCAHGLTEKELQDYHQELVRLLKPGAVYLLFSHLNEENTASEAQNWIDEFNLRKLFETSFQLEKVEHGKTQVNDQTPWRSAWFWFRKDTQ
jgi:cyclopropane fatty-acyl-phospholipid synthase-like methyltransferase